MFFLMMSTLQQNLGVSFFMLPNVLGLKAFNKNRFSYFIVVGNVLFWSLFSYAEVPSIAFDAVYAPDTITDKASLPINKLSRQYEPHQHHMLTTTSGSIFTYLYIIVMVIMLFNILIAMVTL